MKKILCICAILFSFLFNAAPIDRGEIQEKEPTYEVLQIKAEPIIKEEIILKAEVKEAPKKSINELKQEEFNSKLEKIAYLKDENKMEWFNAYKDLTFKYMKWVDRPETVFDAFSEEEVTLICRVVETETYDQDFDSKVNVANVVFNRFESGKFGDTITEVTTKPKQFAYGRKNITEDTILAVMYAYEIGDTTQGALFFNSFKEKREKFCGADFIFQDSAGHKFYR